MLMNEYVPFDKVSQGFFCMLILNLLLQFRTSEKFSDDLDRVSECMDRHNRRSMPHDITAYLLDKLEAYTAELGKDPALSSVADAINREHRRK